MIRKVLSVAFAILGVAGAALSVGMLISALQFSEWGRVVLYAVTLAVCTEVAVLCLMGLKGKK